ncbi:hypothetical protein CR513_07626, partial [Mucuna pruriens]
MEKQSKRYVERVSKDKEGQAFAKGTNSSNLRINSLQEGECWRYCKYLIRLRVKMTTDKVIILGPNELQNFVGPSQLDDHNYLQWTQYIRTMLKGHKKLSHIEGSGPPRDDPKFEALDDEDSLIMTRL